MGGISGSHASHEAHSGLRPSGFDPGRDFEQRAYRWWHAQNLCGFCNGCGMVGPLNDPDCCPVCDGFGHHNGFDIYKDEALAAYREHTSGATP